MWIALLTRTSSLCCRINGVDVAGLGTYEVRQKKFQLLMESSDLFLLRIFTRLSSC